MVTSRCAHCGHLLPESARFCGSCGSSTPDASSLPPSVRSAAVEAPRSERAGELKNTMLQFASSSPQPVAPAVDPHKTMLGFAAPPGTAKTAAPPPSAELNDTIRNDLQGVSPGALGEQTRIDPRGPIRTMLGVAMPGIAPTAPARADAPPPSRPFGGTPPSSPDGGSPMGQTQMGGPALPPPRAGAPPAPVHGGLSKRHMPGPLAEAAAAVRIVPRPPPLVEEPLPEPLRLSRRRGVPVAIVAGAVAVATLIVGGLLLTLSHGTPALTGEPRTGSDGAELLHVSCPSCEPGTQVAIESALTAVAKGAVGVPQATKLPLTHGETDLPLVTPLHVGTNTFTLALARPGLGRDETVTLEVPVTYRITPDLSRLSSRPPELALRVEALTGSEVTVDGAKITLDGSGHGSAPIDVAADVEGPSDEMTLIQHKLAYTVKLPTGTTETGSLALRVGVAQLHLEAPGRTPVTDHPQVTVAGVVAKTAEVYLGDTALAVGSDGRFAQTVPLVLGMTPLVLSIEQGATVATRTMHLAVQRVPDLQAEAASRDAASLPGYDDVADAIDANAGKSIALEGNVVEARQVGRGTILLVDDHRKCAKSPCLTRVLHGDIGDPTTGTVRVYGKVTRSFRTTSGSVVPELEADFLVPGASGKTVAGGHKGTSPEMLPSVRF